MTTLAGSGIIRQAAHRGLGRFQEAIDLVKAISPTLTKPCALTGGMNFSKYAKKRGYSLKNVRKRTPTSCNPNPTFEPELAIIFH